MFEMSEISETKYTSASAFSKANGCAQDQDPLIVLRMFSCRSPHLGMYLACSEHYQNSLLIASNSTSVLPHPFID